MSSIFSEKEKKEALLDPFYKIKRSSDFKNVDSLGILTTIGDIEGVKDTLKLNQDSIFNLDVSKNNALILAVKYSKYYENYNCIKYLVKNTKININAINILGYSAFTYACVNNDFNIANLLLDNGLYVYNYRTVENRLPISYISNENMNPIILRILHSPKKIKNNNKVIPTMLNSFHIYEYNDFEFIKISEKEKSSGSFGAALPVILKKSGEHLILKKYVKCNRSLIDPDSLKEIFFLTFLNSIDNSSVKLYGLVIINECVFLVLEMLTYTLLNISDIYEMINHSEKIEFFRDIFYYLIKGMNTLHSSGIFHSDLKSENIMIDKNNFPKFIDFGLSQFLEINPEKNVIENYMCTEHTKSLDYTTSPNSLDESIITYDKTNPDKYTINLTIKEKKDNNRTDEQKMVNETDDSDEKVINKKMVTKKLVNWADDDSDEKTNDNDEKVMTKKVVNWTEDVDNDYILKYSPNHVNYSTDVFSMGQIFMDCIFYNSKKDPERYFYIEDKLYIRGHKENTLVEISETQKNIMNDYYPDLYDLICKMTNIDSKKRIQTDEILNHPFFKNGSKSESRNVSKSESRNVSRNGSKNVSRRESKSKNESKSIEASKNGSKSRNGLKLIDTPPVHTENFYVGNNNYSDVPFPGIAFSPQNVPLIENVIPYFSEIRIDSEELFHWSSKITEIYKNIGFEVMNKTPNEGNFQYMIDSFLASIYSINKKQPIANVDILVNTFYISKFLEDKNSTYVNLIHYMYSCLYNKEYKNLNKIYPSLIYTFRDLINKIKIILDKMDIVINNKKNLIIDLENMYIESPNNVKNLVKKIKNNIEGLNNTKDKNNISFYFSRIEKMIHEDKPNVPLEDFDNTYEDENIELDEKRKKTLLKSLYLIKKIPMIFNIIPINLHIKDFVRKLRLSTSNEMNLTNYITRYIVAFFYLFPFNKYYTIKEIIETIAKRQKDKNEKKENNRNSSRERDNERSSSREKERSNSREREKERSRSNSREREKERSRSNSREKERDRERSRERDRERDRSNIREDSITKILDDCDKSNNPFVKNILDFNNSTLMKYASQIRTKFLSFEDIYLLNIKDNTNDIFFKYNERRYLVEYLEENYNKLDVKTKKYVDDKKFTNILLEYEYTIEDLNYLFDTEHYMLRNIILNMKIKPKDKIELFKIFEKLKWYEINDYKNIIEILASQILKLSNLKDVKSIVMNIYDQQNTLNDLIQLEKNIRIRQIFNKLIQENNNNNISATIRPISEPVITKEKYVNNSPPRTLPTPVEKEEYSDIEEM